MSLRYLKARRMQCVLTIIGVVRVVVVVIGVVRPMVVLYLITLVIVKIVVVILRRLIRWGRRTEEDFRSVGRRDRSPRNQQQEQQDDQDRNEHCVRNTECLGGSAVVSFSRGLHVYTKSSVVLEDFAPLPRWRLNWSRLRSFSVGPSLRSDVGTQEPNFAQNSHVGLHESRSQMHSGSGSSFRPMPRFISGLPPQRSKDK